MNREEEKLWIEFTKNNVMMTGDARDYLSMSTSAFAQAIRNKRLVPFYVHGEGVGKIRFFRRSDVQKYRVELEARREEIRKGEERNRKNKGERRI